MAATTFETSYQLDNDGIHVVDRNDESDSVVRFAAISTMWCCRRHSFLTMDGGWLAYSHALSKPARLAVDTELFQAFVKDIFMARNDRPIIWFNYAMAFAVATIYCPLYEVVDDLGSWFFFPLLAVLLLAAIVHTRYERRALESNLHHLIDDHWVYMFRDVGYHLRLVVEQGWGINETYIEIWKMRETEIQPSPPEAMFDTEAVVESKEEEEDAIFWVTAFAGFRRHRQPALRYWDTTTKYPRPHRLRRLEAAKFDRILREAKQLPCLRYGCHFQNSGVFFLWNIAYLFLIFGRLRDVFFYFSVAFLLFCILKSLFWNRY